MSEERPPSAAPPPPAAGDGADRRREERGSLMLRVDYADGREFLHDYTENLSRGGAFVVTARRFAVGDKVSVVLSFPGLLAPLKLTGDVRWLRPEATAEGEAGVGVQFSPAAEGLSRLARLVERVRAGDRAVLSEVRRYRVLMVEDNEHVRFLLREGLRAVAERQRQLKVSFEFEEVSNGEEALQLLLEPGHKAFDVVVVDLYLPVMDGHALIRALRASEEHRLTPLLCVSAGGDAELGKAREAGADLCLAKPLQIRTFFETVTKLLRRRADVDPRDDPDSFADEG